MLLNKGREIWKGTVLDPGRSLEDELPGKRKVVSSISPSCRFMEKSLVVAIVVKDTLCADH
jgi:hypothetical protein